MKINMVIQIKVKTNSKEQKIYLVDDIYNIYVKSPAKEGKANMEVIDMIAEYFNVKKGEVNIKRGLKGKKKIIEIND